MSAEVLKPPTAIKNSVSPDNRPLSDVLEEARQKVTEEDNVLLRAENQALENENRDLTKRVLQTPSSRRRFIGRGANVILGGIALGMGGYGAKEVFKGSGLSIKPTELNKVQNSNEAQASEYIYDASLNPDHQIPENPGQVIDLKWMVAAPADPSKRPDSRELSVSVNNGVAEESLDLKDEYNLDLPSFHGNNGREYNFIHAIPWGPDGKVNVMVTTNPNTAQKSVVNSEIYPEILRTEIPEVLKERFLSEDVISEESFSSLQEAEPFIRDAENMLTGDTRSISVFIPSGDYASELMPKLNSHRFVLDGNRVQGEDAKDYLTYLSGRLVAESAKTNMENLSSQNDISAFLDFEKTAIELLKPASIKSKGGVLDNDLNPVALPENLAALTVGKYNSKFDKAGMGDPSLLDGPFDLFGNIYSVMSSPDYVEKFMKWHDGADSIQRSQANLILTKTRDLMSGLQRVPGKSDAQINIEKIVGKDTSGNTPTGPHFVGE